MYVRCGMLECRQCRTVFQNHVCSLCWVRLRWKIPNLQIAYHLPRYKLFSRGKASVEDPREVYFASKDVPSSCNSPIKQAHHWETVMTSYQGLLKTRSRTLWVNPFLKNTCIQHMLAHTKQQEWKYVLTGCYKFDVRVGRYYPFDKCESHWGYRGNRKGYTALARSPQKHQNTMVHVITLTCTMVL